MPTQTSPETFRNSASLRASLTEAAKIENRSKSKIIREAIAEYFKNKNQEK